MPLEHLLTRYSFIDAVMVRIERKICCHSSHKTTIRTVQSLMHARRYSPCIREIFSRRVFWAAKRSRARRCFVRAVAQRRPGKKPSRNPRVSSGLGMAFHIEKIWADSATHQAVCDWVSRPKDFHLEPLAEPYVTLSRHTAPVIQPDTLQYANG